MILLGFAFFDTDSMGHIINLGQDKELPEQGGKALCGVRIVMTEETTPAEDVKERADCKLCKGKA